MRRCGESESGEEKKGCDEKGRRNEASMEYGAERVSWRA
jgi:hypothetical protein